MATISVPEFQERIVEIAQWFRDRFEPSLKKYEAAMDADTPLEDMATRFAELEPGMTYSRLLWDKGVTDFDGNLISAKEGLVQVEARGIPGGNRSEASRTLRDLKLEHPDVHRLLEMMTSKNPGQPLHYVTAEGKFRLRASDVRDALESVAEPVEPVREERATEESSAVIDQVRTEASSPAEEAAALEKAVILRQLVADKRDQSAAGSPEKILLENFGLLNSGKLTVRQLAKQSGISRIKLDRTLAAIREDLRKRLDLPQLDD